MASSNPETHRVMPFFCPLCLTRYPTRKLPLEHLRSDPEIEHKTLRFGACESPHYPKLMQQRVMASPLGCGAYFNGGEQGISKPLEVHIGRAKCRDRRPSAATAELTGPYMATTIVGVRGTLPAQANTTRSDPDRTPPHPIAVEFFCAQPDFTPLHMRTSG